MAVKDCIYMKVTKDAYEIPLAIADTVGELAAATGVNKSTVFRGIKRKGSGYIKVNVEEQKEQPPESSC